MSGSDGKGWAERSVIIEQGRGEHIDRRDFPSGERVDALADVVGAAHLARLTARLIASSRSRRDVMHGPIAHRLWRYIEEQAPLLNGVGRPRNAVENGASRLPADRKG